MYCGIVAPTTMSGSKRPPPRLASAHDASTIAWPVSARSRRLPRSDGASAMPIGRKRRLSRIPATIAATADPPPDSTASDANCAEPANTMSDITIGATGPITGRASTPNENDRSPAASPSGIPTLMPGFSRS